MLSARLGARQLHAIAAPDASSALATIIAAMYLPPIGRLRITATYRELSPWWIFAEQEIEWGQSSAV